MFQLTYINLRYGVLRSRDFVLSDGRRIHDSYLTIFYDDIVWC